MKSYTKEVIFINNTLAPYRIPLFNRIKRKLELQNTSMKAVFLCEKESVREWRIDYNRIEFNYEILKTIYQRRNNKTTTSDVILNRGFLKYTFSDTVVLFGYNYLTYLMIMFLRKLVGRKTMLFCESTLDDKPRILGVKHHLKSALIKTFFSSYIVPGVEAKKFIESYGVAPKDIYIAENAVEHFIGTRDNLTDTDNKYINILYVGRLASEKNIEFVIKNLPSDTTFIYRLIVVGDGPEKDWLRQIKVDYPIEFVGFREGHELAALFYRSDLLVLPSSSEPWGLVVNEAINSGLAVVTSNKVGCRHELVIDNGAVFELGNIRDFQQKMIQVFENLESYKAKSLLLANHITLDNQADKISKVVQNA